MEVRVVLIGQCLTLNMGGSLHQSYSLGVEAKSLFHWRFGKKGVTVFFLIHIGNSSWTRVSLWTLYNSEPSFPAVDFSLQKVSYRSLEKVFQH